MQRLSVDHVQVIYSKLDRVTILGLLREHLQRSIVRIKGTFHYQSNGIPQVSIHLLLPALGFTTEPVYHTFTVYGVTNMLAGMFSVRVGFQMCTCSCWHRDISRS